MCLRPSSSIFHPDNDTGEDPLFVTLIHSSFRLRSLTYTVDPIEFEVMLPVDSAFEVGVEDVEL